MPFGLGNSPLHNQIIATTAALGAGGSFTSPSQDFLNFEAMGVSVFVTAGAGALNVTVSIENSTDGVTFRNVDTINITGGVGASGTLNRVYAVTRRFMRCSVANADLANALAATELVLTQKAFS